MSYALCRPYTTLSAEGYGGDIANVRVLDFIKTTTVTFAAVATLICHYSIRKYFFMIWKPECHYIYASGPAHNTARIEWLV